VSFVFRSVFLPQKFEFFYTEQSYRKHIWRHICLHIWLWHFSYMKVALFLYEPIWTYMFLRDRALYEVSHICHIIFIWPYKFIIRFIHVSYMIVPYEDIIYMLTYMFVAFFLYELIWTYMFFTRQSPLYEASHVSHILHYSILIWPYKFIHVWYTFHYDCSVWVLYSETSFIYRRWGPLFGWTFRTREIKTGLLLSFVLESHSWLDVAANVRERAPMTTVNLCSLMQTHDVGAR